MYALSLIRHGQKDKVKDVMKALSRPNIPLDDLVFTDVRTFEKPFTYHQVQFLRSSFVVKSSSGELSELANQLKATPGVQISTALLKRLNRRGKMLTLESLINK